MTPQEAEAFLARVKRLAEQRALRLGVALDQALADVIGELKAEEVTLHNVRKRAALLTIQKKRHIKKFVSNFPTIGSGLLAYLEGGKEKVRGARLSVDYQAKALHGKYFGRLVAELEEAGVLGDFRRNEHERDVFHEMWELSTPNGKPGSSNNKAAQKIAQIVESVTADMVAQQNRAGAFIVKLPGWILRQSHDRGEIRAAGGPGLKNRDASFKAWRDFVWDRLDHDRTFMGEDPERFLKNVHEGLYTGVHGPAGDENQMRFPGITQGLHQKASHERVLHFKDWEAAFDYNQRFGIKSFRDAVFSDVYFRSRNIALMENLGPNPELTWNSVAIELAEEYRTHADADKQVDSLKTWKLRAAFETVSGKADIPQNWGLTQHLNVVKAVTILAKMGGTLLNALSDTVFMNWEMAHQGISRMQTIAESIKSLAVRSGEEEKFFRYQGIAIDGMIGSNVARYTLHTTVPGMFHRAQQKFFDLNFMNWWTDRLKGAAAKLMVAELGDNAHLAFDKINPQLRNMLELYDISPAEWDLVRATAWEPKGGYPIAGTKLITADKVETIPWEALEALARSSKLQPTVGNVRRVRDALESKLRTYLADRVDYALPTPGAAEKKWLHFGTQAGTPLGEGLRLITLFKSFPVTIITKILTREIHGRGNSGPGQFLMNDHAGKFNLAMLIAMTGVAGYISGAIRDMLKGRTPKRIIDEEGFHQDVLTDALSRGGGLGIMGDYLFAEYDRNYRSASDAALGPVLGQASTLFGIKSRFQRGEFEEGIAEAGKFFQNNTPYINLFYIRPILDYFIFWNLQEMLAPGSLERMERGIEAKNHQGFIFRPSERSE
jgi:hypothetical protein